jgi:hypothetical protein
VVRLYHLIRPIVYDGDRSIPVNSFLNPAGLRPFLNQLARISDEVIRIRTRNALLELLGEGQRHHYFRDDASVHKYLRISDLCKEIQERVASG